MQRTPHRRKAPEGPTGQEVEAKVFGDLITADHIVLGSETDFSRHGDTAALVCQDFSTTWIAGYPAPAKSAAESTVSLQHFIGKVKGVHMYTDESAELEAACRQLEITQDVSTPQRPQNNGVVERAARRAIEGTRCCLLPSGLCHLWLREAMRAYCYNRNIIDKVDDDKSPC